MRAIKLGERAEYFAHEGKISFWVGNEQVSLPTDSKIVVNVDSLYEQVATYLGGATIRYFGEFDHQARTRTVHEKVLDNNGCGKRFVRLDKLPG